MMPHLTIRRAQKEDCPAMMELIKELALFERAPEQVTVSMEHFIESGFGDKPMWWAFVAETAAKEHLHTTPTPSPSEGVGQRQVVAFALYYIRYSTWKGQRMYLEDILVTEAYRGKGIGTMLMNRLIDEMKERELNGMLWQVLEWNEPAIRFYQKYKAHFDAEWINVSLEG